MERTFATPQPVELYVELGRGALSVATGDVTQTTVTVTGKHADEVLVEQNDTLISVIAPRDRAGFFGTNEARLDVTVSLPADSRVITKTGSADQVLEGRYELGKLKSGSGDIRIDDVTGALVVNTGSGDIAIASCAGDLRIKSGSGDVRVAHTTASAGVSTGSGDITFERTDADVVAKSGSGDLGITLAGGDVTAQTASGNVTVRELRRGSLTSKNASGNIAVGIPAGIPVWTDVNTVTGRIASDLAGAGQPEPDQDYIELRATTVSGDISLKQL
ncbi:DUF4097 family beta strand repeat-containing protein [Nocardioides jensenii]|uniref:DUF4097 family beta strand repeat-containing protein n=1 Tax=Nocardioides jensenii TaxID=1843 RepID=UPI0008324944|nr:DUF4097 family beta strand repeat-containing protein [Nocardioides jensenii]